MASGSGGINPGGAVDGGIADAAGIDAGGLLSCGNLVFGCQGTGTGYCADGGHAFCCGGSTPVFCDEPGVGAGCFPAGTTCTSFQRCGDAGPQACGSGATPYCEPNGTLACCSSAYPVHCAGRGCWQAGTDCSSVGLCARDGGSVQACNTGSVAQCDSAGDLHCCPSSIPVYCENADRCYATGIDCNNLTSCGDAGPATQCAAGSTAYCEPDNSVACCNSTYPVHCSGEGCWNTNTDCSTIRTCGDAGPRACSTGSTPYCSMAGRLTCCPAAYPLFCDTQYHTGCWSTGTDCSTVRVCGTTPIGCPTGTHVDCATMRCVNN